jgi:hypothetical protein
MSKHKIYSQPVFVDRSGRRRRMFTALATAGGVVLTVAIVIVTAGFFGVGPGPLPGLPELGKAPQQGPVSPGVRPTGAPSWPAARTTAPAPARSGTVAPPTTAPPTPTASTTSRGNRPTQTPAHPTPSKKK